MGRSLLHVALLALSGLVRSAEAAPSVTVKNGTYSGVYNARYDQEFFLGIPYARPPERFSQAQSLNSTWDDIRKATEYPPHCYGYGGDNIGYKQSEDCLYLNVIRPAGIEDTSDLPVAVWIHGGGLYMGGSADKRYNLSFIVDRSVELNQPIIGVSLNYRVSGFGFLGGKEATEGGATNLGFRDQRLALRWVNENIAAFGGSPGKVTIFGESSGAESVSAQIFAYNGRDDGLFRGAIAESGFGGALFRLAGGFNATDLMQDVYNSLVGNVTSCASLVGSLTSLDCLRQAPFSEINHALNVSKVGPWAPVLDHDFIASYPGNQQAKGNFPKIPILVGANTDEGTAFGQGRGPGGGVVNTDQDMRASIASILPDDVEQSTGKSATQLTNELLALYPNDQSKGIPSLGTWPGVIKAGSEWEEKLGLQYRRANALWGDIVIQYLRRRANQAWSKHNVTNYAYRFDVTVDADTPFIGSTHFQEVAFVFSNLKGNGYATSPFNGSGSYPTQAKALSKTMSTAWVNFFTKLNPNGLTDVGGVAWPTYGSPQSGKEVVFTLNSTYVEMDKWRAKGIDWLISHSLDVLGT
ncbi:hypothetical protein NW762_011549 [Fusarium torreyae]|uniref:Carboxylic ester hydrolase n=1 Tax=Fusarium torreyae TaxID=1237075 RepID=A0A9W8RSI6_9HYPO|nr:hypothetical protein NW762_011549 [Fusarium torreyae]